MIFCAIKSRSIAIMRVLALAALGSYGAQCYGQPPEGMQVPPIPLGAGISLDGSVSLSSTPNITARPASVPAANPFVLPPVAAKSPGGQESEIASLLDLLFNNWAGARDKYALYLLLMPQSLDIKTAAASTLLNEPPNTIYSLRPYILHYKPAAINTVIPPNLSGLDPFKANPADAIFVQLDGFASRVPVSVADLTEANFINGFVTRLTLGSYAAFWNNAGLTPNRLSLSLGNLSPSPGPLSLFVTTGIYPPGSAFTDDISSVLSANPANSMAMMYGWSAADELEKFDATSDHRYIAAAWKLINYRHSFKGIGEITAFTLNYLAGTAQNERIQQIAQGQAPATITDIVQLYKKVASEQGIRAQKDFSVSLGNVATAEFYAVSQNRKLATKSRLILLSEYEAFIDGLRAGQNRAAGQIYQEIAGLTFGLGYQEGFKDGYTAGYAAGWQDGYASGYAAAWSAANVVISGLQQQVSSLQTQLADVQANNGGGGSGDGFWNNIGNTVSTIGTVVGTIASFF